MRLSNLYIALLFIVVCACNTTSEKTIVDALNPNLNLDNGVMLYQQQPFNGVLISNYDLNTVRSKIEYVEGKKHGAELQWYKNGDPLLERFYVKGFKTGVHKSWWENGNLKFEYHFNNRGEFHGTMREWYQSGDFYRSFNYRNGKEVGAQRLWKPDGTIKANYEVINGERFGLIGLKKCYTVTVNEDEIK